MTKREAAIVSAYTGFMLGDFSDMHEYIEEIMEHPVFTHELGSKSIAALVREKSKPDFIKLIVEQEVCEVFIKLKFRRNRVLWNANNSIHWIKINRLC